MKRAQLIVLGIALTAGAGVMYLASGSPPEPVAEPAQVAAPPSISMAQVLVSAVEVPMGATLGQNDMRWQAWPIDAVPTGVIKASDTPNAPKDLAGAMVRFSFVAGEPIRREKLIQAGGSGFMSALLPTGMRAIAISIDNRGSNSAGGFILPNDRVDVIRTYRDEESTRSQGGDVYVSETILRNIRVLAIGQNIQEKDGQRTVVGETATLELDPRQSEMIALAQRIGQLSLALRSIVDSNKTEEILPQAGGGLTVVRYGVSKQSTKQ
jgi:pilus assembly protein CpaB